MAIYLPILEHLLPHTMDKKPIQGEIMFTGKYDINNRDAKIVPPIIEGISTAQLTHEFNELVNIYINLRPRYTVEIGTWHG